MRSVLAVLAASVAFILPVGAFAQITRTKDGWLFRLGLKPGQKVRFRLVVTTEGELVPNGRRESLTVFHFDCRKVEKGVATVHYGIERDEEGEYKDLYLVLKMDRLGKAMWGKQPMTRTGIVFPRRALNVGDTFPGMGKVSAGPLGSGTARDEYRFAGIVEYDGRRLARLDIVSGASLASAEASGSGYVLLDPRDGLMVRMVYDHKADVTMNGKKQRIEQKVEARRL